jgi:hypothetical protein
MLFGRARLRVDAIDTVGSLGQPRMKTCCERTVNNLQHGRVGACVNFSQYQNCSAATFKGEQWCSRWEGFAGVA